MNYLEIEILQDGIDHLSKAIDCFADSDLISQEEFDKLEQFIDELENRKMNAEIELKSFKMEAI
jgi:hypothetical protein